MDSGQKYYINTLTIDIETIPDGELLTVEEMMKDHPKTMKKEETIKAWAEANIDTEFRKRSLNSLKGRLLCIGLKWNDEPSEIIKFQESEEDMMCDLQEKLAAYGSKLVDAAAIVGHNVHGFDLLWLIQRAFKYNLKGLMWMLPMDKNSKRRIDTNDMFNTYVYGAYTKLKDMCKFLNVPTPKDDIDGSEVYDTYLNGELDRIYTYCMKDVDATYACYKKMLRYGE